MTDLEPRPTPNPDAVRFSLPFRLAAGFNVRSAGAATAEPFAAAVFAAGGVASIFGVNDFVTITRIPGADWAPVVTAVRGASSLLEPAPDEDCADDPELETARDLLRAAMSRPVAPAEVEPIEIAIGGLRRKPRRADG